MDLLWRVWLKFVEVLTIVSDSFYDLEDSGTSKEGDECQQKVEVRITMSKIVKLCFFRLFDFFSRFS